MLETTTTILALVATTVFIGLLYYRAELKRNLELLNDPKRDLRRNIPGIGATLSYFFDEPAISQSLKNSKIFNRYIKIGAVIKYAFFATIVLHTIRLWILNFK